VKRELEDESLRKWQREWTQTTKGRTTKDFFTDVAERLKMKINLTVIVTGLRKTTAYLQRFKIIENVTCPCGKRDQTTDHLIFGCELLNKRGTE